MPRGEFGECVFTIRKRKSVCRCSFVSLLMPKEFKPCRTEDNAFSWGSYEDAAAAILIARFVPIPFGYGGLVLGQQ